MTVFAIPPRPVWACESYAARDDLLDAAAVAWSARRIAAGHAKSFINPAQRADDDSEIAIYF